MAPAGGVVAVNAAAVVGTAVGGSVALTGVFAVGALVQAIVRDPGKPTTPEWADGELTQLCAVEYRREPCPICEARHCAGCEAPARAMSTRTVPYEPAHSFAALPPSCRYIASVMSVSGRAFWLAQQINPRWWPRPKTRAAFEAWARRRLRAAGYPPLIGTFPTHRRLP